MSSARPNERNDLPRLIVAIDGPAGAGKSTVARALAERLGYVLVDTGALYRTIALAVSRASISLDDQDAVGALAERIAEERRIRLDQRSENDGGVRVLLDGEDVGKHIRTPAISLGASRVSAVPRVRAALLALQRQAAERGGVVLEGRDIGTVVFPNAEVKFFLTASSDERASRRFRELQEKGEDVTLDATKTDVEKRDHADTMRAIAPLKQADDAILVDSSSLAIEDVVARMVDVVLSRAHARASTR
ncbi:MAG: (d)CMP kinase [Polyangiaceae bacterium]